MKEATHLLTEKQKRQKDFQWYKDRANDLGVTDGTFSSNGCTVSERNRMLRNYGLYNNEFSEVDNDTAKPFGEDVTGGKYVQYIENLDVCSGKIKALQGMHSAQGLDYRVIATNPEATTRKEQEEAKRIRDYVVQQTMAPIRSETEQKYTQQQKGDITQEEARNIETQIQQETAAATPPEVKKYMSRDHQDPAEIMSNQLLTYLTVVENVKRKVQNAWKHYNLAAKAVGYITSFNDEPGFWTVNPIDFHHSPIPENGGIEDCDKASCVYYMTFSDIVSFFSDWTKAELEELEGLPYSETSGKEFNIVDDGNGNDVFAEFTGNQRVYSPTKPGTIKVTHSTWKALSPLQILTYSEGNEVYEKIVSEDYRLNTEAGDISLKKRWIKKAYEAWRIGTLYKNMRPVQGQYKDLNDLNYCKLPYVGVICDNTNANPVCLMDRLAPYQKSINIIWKRISVLMSSDKGKKVAVDIDMLPTANGIDLKSWIKFFEKSPIIPFSSKTEDRRSGREITNGAKVLDFSLISDLGKYLETIEYLKKQAGLSTGITENVEGQVGEREAVKNVQQNLEQTSYILQPYFSDIEDFEVNVLTQLLETSKVLYSNKPPKKLSYILDGISQQFLLDGDVLDNNSYGLFVENSVKKRHVKAAITTLAQNALQAGKVEMSTVTKLLRIEGLSEAEEMLLVAETEMQERAQATNNQNIEAAKKAKEEERDFEREKMQHEKDMVVLKAEEQRETEIVKGSLLAASFNPDSDADNDGQNDFLEVAKHGLEADLATEASSLERAKFKHQKEVDKKKLSIEEQKIKATKNKK